ncbi:MAG: dienelactone hydrolase family protein, partial [Solirubrobacteraceae bacterium]
MPTITIPGGASGPELKAHLAVPPVGDGPWAGVVVLHEAFGLNDDIRQQADRLAAAGYLAVALDLYSAGGAWRCVVATFRSVMAGEGKAFDDIDVARRWLGARPDCSGRVGVIGFCLGGDFALATAARGFDASAA